MSWNFLARGKHSLVVAVRFKGVGRVFHAVAHVYPGHQTDREQIVARSWEERGCPVVSMLPGSFGVSCGPSLSQCPAVYLLPLWKKNTTDTISCGKIRRDIIHDFNLPDDEIVRQVNVAVPSFLFAHGKYEVYRHNRGRFTTWNSYLNNGSSILKR